MGVGQKLISIRSFFWHFKCFAKFSAKYRFTDRIGFANFLRFVGDSNLSCGDPSFGAKKRGLEAGFGLVDGTPRIALC